MRAIERQAIESGRVSGAILMERAGQGAAEVIRRAWPPAAGDQGQALVLCGPGNNGGDGFVIARALAAARWDVTVLATGDPARLPPDARAAFEAWRAIGAVSALSPEAMAEAARSAGAGRPLIVVDAIFGIGLSRPLEPALLAAWQSLVDGLAQRGMMSGNVLKFVAIDVPSGLSDAMPDGPALWDALPVDVPRLTVSFHALKLAHRRLVEAGARISIVDIGLAT